MLPPPSVIYQKAALYGNPSGLKNYNTLDKNLPQIKAQFFLDNFFTWCKRHHKN